VEADPYVVLPIPGGSNSVYQVIGNPDIRGSFQVADYEAITVLLYETDIDGSANKAVTATSRNTITRFAFKVYHTAITNTTDARSASTSTFAFTNARIGSITKRFSVPAEPWSFTFYADSVTQTDA
jgi:hypothetical protein